MFRFVSFRRLAVAAACAGLLAGCVQEDPDPEEQDLAVEDVEVRAFCELEFSCHAEHYDSVEHCVEILSLPEHSSEECGAAYGEVLSCLTEMDSCRSLRNFYLRQPEGNYPCQEQDLQGDVCG